VTVRAPSRLLRAGADSLLSNRPDVDCLGLSIRPACFGTDLAIETPTLCASFTADHHGACDA